MENKINSTKIDSIINHFKSGGMHIEVETNEKVGNLMTQFETTESDEPSLTDTIHEFSNSTFSQFFPDIKLFLQENTIDKTIGLECMYTPEHLQWSVQQFDKLDEAKIACRKLAMLISISSN